LDNAELFATETENEMEIVATLTPQDKELHESHAFLAHSGTAKKHAKALKEHGEVGAAAALDGLTRLSQGEVPGWGNSDTEGDAKPAVASAAVPPVIQQIKRHCQTMKMFAASAFSILCNDNDMLQCFSNHPAVSEDFPFALDCDAVATAQNQDAAVLLGLASQPQAFRRFEMSKEVNIVCYVPGPDQPFKMHIPDAMLNNIIHFCHLALNHIVMTRLCNAIALHFYHLRSQENIKNIVRPCEACQQCKQPG
jgi:hypothetical protein